MTVTDIRIPEDDINVEPPAPEHSLAGATKAALAEFDDILRGGAEDFTLTPDSEEWAVLVALAEGAASYAHLLNSFSWELTAYAEGVRRNNLQ